MKNEGYRCSYATSCMEGKDKREWYGKQLSIIRTQRINMAPVKDDGIMRAILYCG
jgi:hypothetical protein